MLLLSVIYVILSTASVVLAAFDPGVKTNLAVYWGQNSAGSADSQTRLSNYCTDSNINIIPISFLTSMNAAGGQPVLNVANQGGKCTTATEPMKCPEIEEDIKVCQGKGKTILLSLGGDRGAGFNYADEAAAKQGAEKLWKMFGPDQHKNDIIRPFGSAVVDGFDFDFETEFQNAAAFAQGLRDQMRASSRDKTYYLSAAPMCATVPGSGKSVIERVLDQVQLDMVSVQFYNDGNCDVTRNFNFEAWNTWAKTKNTTFLVGLPASSTAARSTSHVAPEKLKDVFGKAKGLEKMGGAMLWDASQAWANDKYHVKVKEALATAALARRHWDVRTFELDG
ncbi:glycoside hydrolase family 18 protein [Plenodomus tracheiphilus IPT5]|uniref:chitinase n=1 Tax=Plenodomus tracheiphilus IPT5 TaxID=1408161 RepID=A0A6A7BJT7_9PLEO|nr:glycoside hydrolase family 18 protein [Plenodomus tracheiphilus IPT5]